MPEINADSEMPPIKKKDFYELMKNNDDAYNKKLKDQAVYIARATLAERKARALEEKCDKKDKEYQMLYDKVNNNKMKNEKSTEEFKSLMEKSNQKKIYLEKNMDKLVDDEMKKMSAEISAFEKKHGVKI